MTTSDPAWQFFAALQREADPQSIDRSLARDEALDVILNEIVSDPAPDQDLLRKRFYSLCRNRLSKHNNRRALDRRRSKSTHRQGGTDFGSVLLTAPQPTVFNQLAYAQLMGLSLTVLAEEELKLLVEISDGHSYADMARERNISLSSLKSKAFRVREKVRSSPISATLRSWQRG
jgi:DNA-binding CsgD family transcriptional regulator